MVPALLLLLELPAALLAALLGLTVDAAAADVVVNPDPLVPAAAVGAAPVGPGAEPLITP